MFQKNSDFSKSDLERMLRQPEARALLARLQQLDQNALCHICGLFAIIFLMDITAIQKKSIVQMEKARLIGRKL